MAICNKMIYCVLVLYVFTITRCLLQANMYRRTCLSNRFKLYVRKKKEEYTIYYRAIISINCQYQIALHRYNIHIRLFAVRRVILTNSLTLTFYLPLRLLSSIVTDISETCRTDANRYQNETDTIPTMYSVCRRATAGVLISRTTGRCTIRPTDRPYDGLTSPRVFLLWFDDHNGRNDFDHNFHSIVKIVLKSDLTILCPFDSIIRYVQVVIQFF